MTDTTPQAPADPVPPVDPVRPAPAAPPAPPLPAAPLAEPADWHVPGPEAYPGGIPVAQLDAPPPPRPARRRLRAAARWTAAVLVFAVLGGAATYAVTRPERTRIPGLKTPADGRWAYPPLALPKLPAGEPRPLATANTAGVHYADLRSLLLPLPEQAVSDHSFPGPTGWLPYATYLKRYDFGLPDLAKNAGLAGRDDGLRHIAARAWTMPDGTRTEVYLAQFLTAPYRAAFFDDMSSAAISGALDVVSDPTVESTVIPADINALAMKETKPYGATAARYAYLSSGDTLALVVQTRKGSVAEVPFDQTVRLQAQLLG
ncbi:hypothetical protein SAMN05216223_119128 [Actinacidiphila yanglinensis]|uniref:Uncharacterized protein n=1 Tax=Actinacidiphila yanglinensis TaxID=310779 RepID=A0A1H6DTQ3_9ACTN|nr:hypothetical protein SAMN05216223_119128 [Actinacidiphila yanglinensis]